MDVTNRSLALLMVAALVVSLGGTIVSLNRLNQLGFTGLATSSPTGTTNFTINSSVVITFPVSNVNFGEGYTNDTTPGAPIEYCYIDTNFTNPTATNCTGFNSGNSPFQIRNDGNLDVSLRLTVNATAAQFISGTTPKFQWYLVNNESGSCTSFNASMISWNDTTTSTVYACGASGSTTFNFEDSGDQVALHIKVVIPQDAVPGNRIALITAYGDNP